MNMVKLLIVKHSIAVRKIDFTWCLYEAENESLSTSYFIKRLISGTINSSQNQSTK